MGLGVLGATAAFDMRFSGKVYEYQEKLLRKLCVSLILMEWRQERVISCVGVNTSTSTQGQMKFGMLMGTIKLKPFRFPIHGCIDMAITSHAQTTFLTI